MTPEQINISKGLGTVTTLSGGFDKRFMSNISAIAENTPDKEITDKQNEWMYRLLYKYRRQLPGLYEKHKTNPYCCKLKK